MATIIDCGNGRFIVGDPASELGEREHWCWCGDGLDCDDNGDLIICWNCSGTAIVACDDSECAEHGA